jgi:MFS family permease
MAKTSLVVLVLINIVNFYDRNVGGALAEPMRHEFGLNDTQIGWIGTAFTLLYAVIGLPFGRIADTRSRKKLLAAGVALWGTLTGFAAWAINLPMLIFSRLGLGVGVAAVAPTATSWIGDLFPPERRSKALALFMLGVPVGGGLSYIFSGPIAQAFGWRRAMIVAAIPALLLAPLVLLLREPERGAAEIHAARTQGSVWQLFRVPTFWWIIASGIFVNFNLYAVATFLPAFFQRIHSLNLRDANLATGAIFLIGGTAGGSVGGFWGDSIVRRRPNGRMLAASLAALVAVPLSYVAVSQGVGHLALTISLLTLTYGFLNTYYGLVYASIQDIVAPTLRGTAMAVYFLVMYLGGASFGPVLTGRLSDRLALRAATAAGSHLTEAFKAVGLHEAMLVIPALSLALGLVLWAGSRTLVGDMAGRVSADRGA